MGEIDAVRALLGGRPRPEGWAERRRRIEEVAGIDPLPAGVTVTPTEIAGRPAAWSEAPGADPTRVLLFLHGGGYCSGSLRSHRTMAAWIARSAGMRVLALDYRLAPEYPFPAGLEDAQAAFRALAAQGLAPERIAVGGDSAGGGMSLALALGLKASGEALPGCLWLASPWVDLALTGASLEGKDAVDPLLHRGYLDELAAAYVGAGDRRAPLVSPLYARAADLAGLPPVLIQVGSSETLLDDAVRMAGALGGAGVPVTLEVWPEMIHAFVLWSARRASGRAAAARAGAFLSAWLDRGAEGPRPDAG